ncbi:hypothetical protein GCM10020000_71560 [Streptomyces olivoverticillatus]
MAAYQIPAARTAACRAGLPARCPARTSSSEVSAIVSHSSRKVETEAAAGTSTRARAKTGRTAWAPREAMPCGPWPAAYPMP